MIMNKVTQFLAVSLIVATISCEETVLLDVSQITPRVVIEGLVTNQNKKHYVRITRTNDFYSKEDVSGISDAEVKVEDDQGNVYNYAYAPDQSAGADGYYFSESAFAGKVGATYTLTVVNEGEIYTGSDVLQPVTSIDSLSVVINRSEFRNPDDPGYFYEVLIYAKEPQERDDFYLFKFYRNDSLVVGMETDIYIADDELLGEKIDGIAVTGFYKHGDIARVELYSLSRQGFVFYSDLYTLLTSDGGMFSPPPANPRTNLSNDALGYFQTSAAAIERIKIE